MLDEIGMAVFALMKVAAYVAVGVFVVRALGVNI